MYSETLQTVFALGFDQYAKNHKLPPHYYKAAYYLKSCRTATLGGHIQACPEGHVQKVWYNSCHHRSCPQCSALQIERWLQQQMSKIYDCRHHHIIFTFPHELNPLWLLNTAKLTDCFFAVMNDTLKTLCLSRQKILPGFVAALHTWGRSLSLHPHLHCLISDGGRDEKGQWKNATGSCFIPARVLMTLFRGKLLAKIRSLLKKGELKLPSDQSEIRFNNLLNKLGRKKWHIFIKEQYASGCSVIKYLSRYVRGGAIKNKQILSVTAKTVTYLYYAHHDNPDGKRKKHTVSTVDMDTFLQRIFWHLPEPGKQVYRRYGLYANKVCCENSPLKVKVSSSKTQENETITWQALMQGISPQHAKQALCPQCQQLLIFTETLPPYHDPPTFH